MNRGASGASTPIVRERRTTAQLLAAAKRDTDAASVFWLGTGAKDSDDCIIVIKGREHSQYVVDMLIRQQMLTPGKSVEGA